MKESKENLILFLSFCTTILLHLPLTVFPVFRDQGVWGTAGMAINSGRIFFKDYLHFNLPGLGFSYALAFKFTDSIQNATMLLSLIGSLLTIFGMYFLLKVTINKNAAVWSVLIFSIIWPTHVNYWHIAQKDFMATYGLLISTGLAAYAFTAKWRKTCVFLSGLMVGISAMYKPVFAFTYFLLVLAFIFKKVFPISEISTKKRNDWLELLKDLALLTAGAGTIAVLFLLYLYFGNAIQGFYNGVFIFAPEYAKIARLSLFEQLSYLFLHSLMLGLPIDKFAIVSSFLWLIIIVNGLTAFVRKDFIKEKLLLSVPFLSSLFTYLIQGKGFSYHAIPWKICLIMLAGSGLSHIWNKVENPVRTKPLAKILTIFLILVFCRSCFASHYAQAEVPAWLNRIDRTTYLKECFSWFKHDSGYPGDLEIENLSNWLKAKTSPDDKILVWGLECQLYALSRRMYATHSPFDIILTADLSGNPKAMQWQKSIRTQFVGQLKAERPKFIIVVTNDLNPVEFTTSNEAISLIPEFREILDNFYNLELKLKNFEVYRFDSIETRQKDE
jgi:hypothetical protein